MDPLIHRIDEASFPKMALHFRTNPQDFIADIERVRVQKIKEGHIHPVHVLTFQKQDGTRYGRICIKYAKTRAQVEALKKEKNALSILRANGFVCPQVIDIRYSENGGYSILEYMSGKSLAKTIPKTTQVYSIAECIARHGDILTAWVDVLDTQLASTLRLPIDYDAKIRELFGLYAPSFRIIAPLGYLNEILNSPEVLRRRTIVTDRSATNMFLSKPGPTFIDFSTLRPGTPYDNWIQCIDDPRVHFPLSRTKLVALVLGEFPASNEQQLFDAAAVLTNLLQGIFIHSNNPELANGHFAHANTAYEALVRKKKMLIAT